MAVFATPAYAPPPASPAASGAAPGRPEVVLAWCRLGLLVLARAYRALLATMLATAMLPMLWSWTSYVVRSDSMEPALSVGDVVVAKPFSAPERVPVGRVMLFTPPSASVGGDEVRVHRVVENRGRGSYTTAGDANRSVDPEPVQAERFHHRAVICVPFVALPLTWWRDEAFLRLALFLVLTAGVLYLATWPPVGPRPQPRAIRGGGRGQPPDQTGRLGARAAALGRTMPPVLSAVVIASAAAAGLPSEADAAFTATTANRGSTWRVSPTLAHRVVMTEPESSVRGTVQLGATLVNTDQAAYSVRLEYAVDGTGSWKTICTDSAAPYACSWNTAALANGSYDLRAVAAFGGTTLVSPAVEEILVDNTGPSVSLRDPGTPLRGVTRFTATASDAHSGVADVVVQYAASGSSTYRELCRVEEEPYSCDGDTSTLPNGSYSFRAVATDAAGNTSTSAAVTNRVVDNTVSSVTMLDPGEFLTKNVTLRANASSNAGVVSVRVQGAPAGTGAWTDICTDLTAPYTCSQDTDAVSDGLYDLRAVMLDGSGRTTISAVVRDRRVDNTSPRGSDVQATNGGVLGQLGAGDTISLTYNKLLDTASITTGWDGRALPVSVRVRDGNLLGRGSRGDTLDVLRGGAGVNLGSVNLGEDYVTRNQTVQFAATMTASTTSVGGLDSTRVTVTLGAQTGGGNPRRITASATMAWAPATLAHDLAGRAVSSSVVTESGSKDRDF